MGFSPFRLGKTDGIIDKWKYSKYLLFNDISGILINFYTLVSVITGKLSNLFSYHVFI